MNKVDPLLSMPYLAEHDKMVLSQLGIVSSVFINSLFILISLKDGNKVDAVLYGTLTAATIISESTLPKNLYRSTAFIALTVLGLAYANIKPSKKRIPPPKTNSTPELKEFFENNTPITIKKFLDESVIGQENAKLRLSLAFYTTLKGIFENTGEEKSNILLIGPTGSGKTFIVKKLAEHAGIPFYELDAGSLSKTGYVGQDPAKVIQNIYALSGYNRKVAERTVVFIDEVDKLAEKPYAQADVVGKAVQKDLLKVIEGTEVPVKNLDGSITKISTKNMLFIAGGAFVGLTNTPNASRTQSLIQFGFIPEFIGRFTNSVDLERLSKNDLLNILKNAKKSVLIAKKNIFKRLGVTLKFDENTLELIAKNAFLRDTGARALKGEMDDLLYPFETKLYSNEYPKGTTLTITKNYLETKDIKKVIITSPPE